MCIKHTQFYECPTQSHNPPKKHCVRTNILCSQVFPCPALQWERRVSHYDFMCPGCSGESPAVPRSIPIGDEWARNELQDEAWVQSYLSEYCHSVLLWVRSQWDDEGGVTETEMAESWFNAFFMERRCKEKDHGVGQCRCDANGPLSYFYNPTAAARRHLTDMAADKFERDARVQCPAMQGVFTNRHIALSAMCSEKSLHFTDGIARQPFFSERAIKRRRRILQDSLDRASKTAEALVLQNAESARSGGGWTAAHTLEMTHVSKRASLVRFMGEVLLYDSGISNSRFSLAVSWLVHIIQVPAWRTQSNVETLEKLARIANSTDQAPTPAKPFTCLVQLIQQYYFGKRADWNGHVMKYKARRTLFDAVTGPVDAGRDLRNAQGQARCPICNECYYKPPMVLPQIPHPGVNMFVHGEPACEMKDCGCLFGRRCLFKWITDRRAEGKELECRSCGNDFPAVEYGLVEASTGYSIRKDHPGEL